MDAVKFLKEKQRMCNAHFDKEYRCQYNCPIRRLILDNTPNLSVNPITCRSFLSDCPNKAVEVIEQWSKDNPQEIDWSKVPVDTPVWVWDWDEDDRKSRCFNVYLPCSGHKFCVFDNGDLQKNAISVSQWKYCEFASGVDPEPYYKD